MRKLYSDSKVSSPSISDRFTLSCSSRLYLVSSLARVQLIHLPVDCGLVRKLHRVLALRNPVPLFLLIFLQLE